jgi:hypothetical protein
MFDSIKYIDFNEDILLNEAYTIMQLSNGGFNWQDLRNMAFTTYEKIVNITKPIVDKLEKDMKDN